MACRVLAALLAILILNSSAERLQAQQVQATEAQVKAAFLFNFGKYVTWPRESDERFSLCVIGRDPFGKTLDGIVSGEKIAGKPLEVRRIQSTQDAGPCQVLFISASEEARARSIVEGLANAPVLTVSDMRNFTEHGGMIQFVNEGDRVRFVINLQAAQKAGLVMSSELLKVAKSVRTDQAVK